jgi:hypothetical protein
MARPDIAYLSELFFADQFLWINDGYGLDWLKSLDAVEALGAEIFVPAHGPIPADPRETKQGLARGTGLPRVGRSELIQVGVSRRECLYMRLGHR